MTCTIFQGNWGKQGVCTQITAIDFDNTCTLTDQKDFLDLHPAGAEENNPDASGTLYGTKAMVTPVVETRLKQTRCAWVSCYAGERRRV